MTIDLSPFNRPALQFSGGKDSLACLYLLREPINQGLPVYWLNSGDTCPETLAVIEQMRPTIPNFVDVRTDVRAWRAANGMPTDVLPQSSTQLGVAYGMSSVPMVGRFDCCVANRILPMHERMMADGIDCVIRGTKLADTGRLPAEGATPFYHVLLPIRDWSHQQVFDYLRSVGAPYNAVYDNFANSSTLDCVGCTAVWDDGKAAYFRTKHPQRWSEYRASLETIRAQLQHHLSQLDKEIEGGHHG